MKSLNSEVSKIVQVPISKCEILGTGTRPGGLETQL